jgi:uncharacterized protein (DUF1697 family)
VAVAFAFLRAINTGGRRLTNDALLAPFRQLGLDEPRAYQASGNVVFRTDRDLDDLEEELASVSARAYGFDVPVFLRSDAELRAVTAAVPFSAEQLAATERRAQVTFLASTPDEDRWSEVLDLTPAEDLVALHERQWYWLPRAGVSTSLLPVSRIERILGPMTMRTVATLDRLITRFGA